MQAARMYKEYDRSRCFEKKINQLAEESSKIRNIRADKLNHLIKTEFLIVKLIALRNY